LSRVLAVAANTFRETVRERVLYNLVFFALVMTFSGFIMREISIMQDDKILKDLALAAIDLFGNAMAIFLGVGLVSKEIERRSLYPLLAKPLTRDEFLLGKYIGLAYTLFVNVAVMVAALYLTLALNGRRLDLHLLKAVLALYAGFLLLVAIALLLSTMTSVPLAAVGSLGLLLAGRFSDIVLHMREVAPGAPEWFITALYWALPNFKNFDIKNHIVYGDPVPWSTMGMILLYAAVYITVVLGAALSSFRRRDFQ
jgi:ABC-type transport system involved in multi-copper enzyme maturation permease subunit